MFHTNAFQDLFLATIRILGILKIPFRTSDCFRFKLLENLDFQAFSQLIPQISWRLSHSLPNMTSSSLSWWTAFLTSTWQAALRWPFYLAVCLEALVGSQPVGEPSSCLAGGTHVSSLNDFLKNQLTGIILFCRRVNL